jgi:hypothetical protein
MFLRMVHPLYEFIYDVWASRLNQAHLSGAAARRPAAAANTSAVHDGEYDPPWQRGKQ